MIKPFYFKSFIIWGLFCLVKPSFSQSDTAKNIGDYDIMSEVFVSGDKDVKKLKESTVAATIIKPYLIQNKIIIDASRVLNQVPGVNVTDGQINIRSGSGWSYGAGSRVMVNVDGMPILAGDVGSVPISFLPTEMVDAIEVIKNAGSVLYGSSAVNGVVDMRSAPITNKQNININVYCGNYQFPNSNLQFRKLPCYNYGLNGVFSEKVKQHSVAIYWNQINDDGYRLNEHDYRVRMGWRYTYEFKNKLSPLSISLNGSTQKGHSGSFLIWQSSTLAYTTSDSSHSFTTGRRLNIDPVISWNGKSWKHKFQNRFFNITNDIDNGDSTANQNNSCRVLYSEFKSKRNFLSNLLELNLGAVSNQIVSTSSLFGGNHKVQNFAGYSQLSLKLNGWIIQAGGRYEYYKLDNRVFNKPVMRLGINKNLSKATFLRMSVGQGYRFPSIAELFTTTHTGSVFVYPNANLIPENSQNAEIGIKQGLKLTKKASAFIDFAIYRTNFDNMMEYCFSSWQANSFPGFKSINIGKTRTQGFELESSGIYQNNSHKFLWLTGYTYCNATVLNPNAIMTINPDGQPITYANTTYYPTNILKYRNKHLFRFDLQYQYKRMELGTSIRYQSAFENIDAAFAILIKDVESVYTTGKNSGLITDIRFGYQLDEFIRFQAQVSNLFQVIYMDRPANMNAPRLFQIQFNYRFAEK